MKFSPYEDSKQGRVDKRLLDQHRVYLWELLGKDLDGKSAHLNQQERSRLSAEERDQMWLRVCERVEMRPDNKKHLARLHEIVSDIKDNVYTHVYDDLVQYAAMMRAANLDKSAVSAAS